MWLASSRERQGAAPPAEALPSHAGLGYTRWAPRPVLLPEEDPRGTVRRDWLDRLARCREPARYAHAYRRWWNSLQGPETLCFIVQALGRVLVGHGNPVATGVGLTLHHTWGVPVLPGTALKGLSASYVEAAYGPVPGHDPALREPFRGVTRKGTRPVRGPGAVYRRLFGAPDVEDPREGASQGEILFHDALWVPTGEEARPMLARDVLTVHQRTYYESAGKEWPGDFDDPNPVSFLTVAPEGRFLVALGVLPGVKGGRVLLERAGRYLMEALEQWGLGGKTAAGYGRFTRAAAPAATKKGLETPTLAELKTWLEAQRAQGTHQREQFRQLEHAWRERLLSLAGEERQAAAHLLKQSFNLKRGEEQQRLDELLAHLRGPVSPPRP